MDVTICPICMETLQNPRCIPCSHNFCQQCLNNHINNSCIGKDFPTGFHCPVCRKYVPGSISTDNPSLWAETFPKNAIIEFMIKSNDEKVLKLCKPCLNDNKEESASTLCGSCMECLCAGCTDHHKKLTITKEHEVVPLNVINKSFHRKTEENFCSKHDFRYIELYCFDHDTPCCSVCCVTDHKTCKMDTIETAFENIEKDNDSLQMISEIDRVASHLKKLKEIQKEKQSIIEDKADEIRDESKRIRQEINETMEKLEHEPLEDLAEGMKATRKAIAGNMETFSDLIDLSNHCKAFLANPSKKSCNPGYVGGFYQIKKQLKRLKSAKLSIKDTAITATFSSVLKEVKSSKQLASLTVNEKPISLSILEFQSIPKGIAQVEKTVLDIYHKYGARINEMFLFENDADLFVCVDDKTNLVCTTSGLCRKSVHFGFTILHAVMMRGKIYAVSNRKNLHAIEYLENSATYSRIKFNINRRCFSVSVFQENLVVGCNNAILHLETNGKEQKIIPAEGRVLDVISLNIGNIVYIGRTVTGMRIVRGIESNGRELWKYEHSELKRPWGLTKDFVENIYIAGNFSNNIHMLSSAGYALKIFEQIPLPSRMILRKESNDEFYVVSASTSVKQVKLIL